MPVTAFSRQYGEEMSNYIRRREKLVRRIQQLDNAARIGEHVQAEYLLKHARTETVADRVMKRRFVEIGGLQPGEVVLDLDTVKKTLMAMFSELASGTRTSNYEKKLGGIPPVPYQ